MKRLKNITILLCFLSLLAFIGCDTESKTGGKVTPPSEPEIVTIEIEAKDFPADLLGQYRDDKVYSKFTDETDDTLFRQIDIGGGIKVIIINGKWLKKYFDTKGLVRDLKIEKWIKTTKGGKTIKLESIEVTKDSNVIEATITYDYETKTLSGTYTDGTGATFLFNGKRIGDLPAIFQ